MRHVFSKFLRDQSGATAIEYCLIAVGIAIVIIAAVNGIGSSLNTGFTSVNSGPGARKSSPTASNIPAVYSPPCWSRSCCWILYS